MPLATDYRPANFNEVIGNKSTISSIKSILAREDKQRFFLLQGPSGCGKTTLARIIKSELECHDQDYIEIGARGIDTAKEIVSMARYKPMSGPVRMIIVNQAHHTTKDFQEALLDLLENPPEHFFFIACTTDPTKLIKEFKTRGSIFEVNKLSEREMNQLLDWVLTEESTEINEQAGESLIEAADGCPRSLLTILDQIIDLPLEEQEAAVQEAAIGDKQVIDLCRALIKGQDWPMIAEILKGLKKEDSEKIRYAVLGYMNTILLSGEPKAALIIDCFREPMFYSAKAGLTLACWESII